MPDPVAVRLALFYAATFTAVGIYLPFWPLWLEQARGLSPTEIGYVLAAGFWPRIVTNLWLPNLADRLGARRPLMALLAAITLIGVALFGVSRGFWPLLALSALTGASWAAILPLGEALVLREIRPRQLRYGRVRLWGSITFIVAAIGGGRWLEIAGPGIVLPLMLGAVALTLIACLTLPETRRATSPEAPTHLRRLLRQRDFLAFVLAAGLIGVSHAVYYGFATLHWRAAGHGEAVIGWLWAEGVIAEVLFFLWSATWAERLGPWRLLSLAGLVTVLRWIATALSTDLVVLIPAQALHAASFAAVHLAAMHYIRDRTPAELHASAQGIHTVVGGALLFGLVTPLAGWLYGHLAGGAFLAMAAVAAAGTLLAARGALVGETS